MPARSPRPPKGLTLLEVLISLALMSILVGALLTFYFQSIEIRRAATRIADRTEIARQVLDRMASELRGCFGVNQFGFPVEQRIVGARRSIQFLTAVLPAKDQYQFFGEFDQLPPGQHDLRQVGYRLWCDPENQTEAGEPIVNGIVRTEKKTLNQFLVDEQDPEQLRSDIWSPELVYLEFRYFDGVEWATKWEVAEGNPLPHLIQITVGFEPITQAELDDQDLSTYPIEDPEYCLGDGRPHPERYSTIVRIPAADRFFSSRLQRVGREFSEQLGIGGGK
jgi:prepilin-type N-terminal cleavage/methylation domain-containing protein